MLNKHLLQLILLIILSTAHTNDFCFPSHQNPAWQSSEDIDQYITIIWNDNFYSGLDGTPYFSDTGKIIWQENNCIGGKEGLKTHGFPSWWPSKNIFNIEEGNIGMAWAMQLGVPMTFNMISGLYVPQSNPINSPDVDGDGVSDGWANRESPLGYWKENKADQIANGGINYIRVPISWGSEQEIVDGGEKIQPPCNIIATNLAISQGHEIGNHTIDHMAPDSPLPGGSSPFSSRGFGLWGNEGYDSTLIDSLPWGEVINEANHFNQDTALTINKMGWTMKAGAFISSTTWIGVIDLAEKWFFQKTSLKKEMLYGFCAPRSEVNSALYYALANKSYEYDCSLEEGNEAHRNGSNFLWPYTLDNGSINSWTQFDLGERRSINDLPSNSGLWEIPITKLVVPEDIRESVWRNHKEIRAALGSDADEIEEEKREWILNGMINAIDFNAFILWGMTTENWLKTMKNSIELRQNGNKAPFHYSCHSDYYTPNYDYRELLSPKKRNSWGLPVIKKWNTWNKRISTMEEWISWAKERECKFVTGHQLITTIKKLSQKAPTPGEPLEYNPTFTLQINEKLPIKTIANKNSFTKSADIHISIAPPHENNDPIAAYVTQLPPEEISYISLAYKVNNGSLVLRLNLEGEASREVLLNNVNNKHLVPSGLIPITAFDYNQYELTSNIIYDKPIDFNKLRSLEIQPIAPRYKSDGTHDLRSESFDISFEIQDLIIFGKGTTPSLSTLEKTKKSVEISSISNRSLQLRVNKKNTFSFRLFTLNGRLIQEISHKTLSKGIHNIPIKSISKGLYILKISDPQNRELISHKCIL